MQLQNKKIIVTGGTRGIGAATVKLYVKEGAQVVFCGTNEVRGKETETTVNSLGYPGHATYLNCNIASKAAVDEFFAKALEILGGELHVLANVAGVEANMAATDYTKENTEFLMDVNLYGTIYTNQAAYEVFKKNGVEGSIINYASDVALSGMPNGAMYAASKAAVVGWTRSIAMEWGIESNVRTNCVNPTIRTEMYNQWLATVDPAVKEMHLAGLKRRYPIDGMMGDAERDCSPIMVFLDSEGSRYINGQIFCVNGGATMTR